MKSQSRLPLKIGLVVLLVGAGMSVLPGLRTADPLAASRIDGASRLTVHRIAMDDGAMCEVPAAPQAMAAPVVPIESVPVNPVTAALALRTGATPLPVALEEAQAQTPSAPTAAQKAAVAARRPIRTIRDQYPQFSAVAVDAQRNEVVIQDENLFQILVFDRTTNTPPTATMSEPE